MLLCLRFCCFCVLGSLVSVVWFSQSSGEVTSSKYTDCFLVAMKKNEEFANPETRKQQLILVLHRNICLEFQRQLAISYGAFSVWLCKDCESLLCLYWISYCSPAVKWQMDMSILRDLRLLADSWFLNPCIIKLAIVLQEGRKTKIGKKNPSETYGARLYCEILKSKFLSSFWRQMSCFSEWELSAFSLFL